MILLGFTLKVNDDQRLLVRTGLDFEGPKGNNILNSLVREFATDETLGIEDGVGGVTSCLVLCGITNEALFLSKGNIRGGCVDTLVIGDDFDFII